MVVGADVSAPGVTGGVHAFDRATGRERWKYAAGRGVGAAVTRLGRRIFAPTYEGELLALDLRSGAREWSVPFVAPGFEGPTVGDNRVFAAGADGAVHAVSAETGKVEWKRLLSAGASTSAILTETSVYVGTSSGEMHRLDRRDGAILSSRRLDEKLRPFGVPGATADSLLVLLADQGADYRALVSVALPLNEVRWRVQATDQWSTTEVFLWRDMVVLGAPSGEVTAYCTGDGSHAWSRVVTGRIRSIGGSEDALYVGTTQGTLYAVPAPARCGTK